MNDLVRILLVDDEPSLLRLLQKDFADAGLATLTFNEPRAALEHIRRGGADVVVTDWNMPGMTGLDLLFHTQSLPQPPTVIILTGYGTVDRAVEALSNGAFHFLEKPVDTDKLIALVRKAQGRDRSARGNSLDGVADASSYAKNIFATTALASISMQGVFETARQVALSDSTVLLLGESGSGKEVLARHIHANSSRAGKPFVVVNSGALPDHLAESELFGHEKGAFTGAFQARQGRFEAAHGGTLFLDEIGDLKLELQVKLLRALQSRAIERVGSNTPIPVDIRLICATHRDLEAEVAKGSFREDLLYRIKVIPIRIPPLRDRVEDIAPLAKHFLRELGSRLPKAPRAISRGAMHCLESYPWPGNVRQLRNAIEYALVMCKATSISPEHLPESVRTSCSEMKRADDEPSNCLTDYPQPEIAQIGTLKDRLDAWESRIISDCLDRNQWSVVDASKELKLSRSCLYERMKRHHIKRDERT